MANYIIVDEDGQVYQSEVLTEDEENLVGLGVIDAIRLSDKKILYEGSWHDLPVWGEL